MLRYPFHFFLPFPASFPLKCDVFYLKINLNLLMRIAVIHLRRDWNCNDYVLYGWSWFSCTEIWYIHICWEIACWIIHSMPYGFFFLLKFAQGSLRWTKLPINLSLHQHLLPFSCFFLVHLARDRLASVINLG